jgi:hypothetical protein
MPTSWQTAKKQAASPARIYKRSAKVIGKLACAQRLPSIGNSSLLMAAQLPSAGHESNYR